MSMQSFRGAVEWALMVALVFGAGAVAQAQNDESKDDAKVIQIGPADGHGDAEAVEGQEEGATVEAPKYWIGLLGGPVTAELRHHVELPDGEGILIREIVPDSPAAKAGLQQYDIVVRANDAAVHDMRELVDLVRTEGEKEAQITFEVIRHGTRESVYVTPEERPEQVAYQGRGGGIGGIEGLPPQFQQFFEEGGEGVMPFDFRQFGPGVIVGGGGAGLAGMPNGISVSIQKQEGEPTKITVKRGEESWEVVGDDPKSLEQLPEDVRPFVERMLQGGAIGGLGDFNMEMPQLGPNFRSGPNREQFQQRLEQMERRLEELQERMLGRQAPATDKAEAESNGEVK
jgi:membrane-associated protease RseP (regulator of RpoE activity)